MYTISLFLLCLGILFGVIAGALFFSWNIRKLRRDVKGITKHELATKVAVSSVDSYIQLSDADFQGAEELSEVSVLDSPIAEEPIVTPEIVVPQLVAPELNTSEASEAPTNLLDVPKEVSEESATTLLVESPEEEVSDDCEVLKQVTTYQSWSVS